MTVRDLPALCLLFAGIFAFAALALPLAAKLDMAQKAELYRVSGTVQSVSHTNAAKVRTKLNLFARDGDRVHDLTQDDLSYDVPALRSLRPGDNVSALVRHDLLGRDLEWIWELQRDGITILSYEQTRKFLEGERSLSLAIARWSGALSIALLLAGLFLRIRLGAWRDGTRKAVN
ncbi:MAG TPA: hypothetical protein VGU63_09820 [Candidatus Acidoferrales bacterium]|nr:hypothetical protein [Candidatus Acidoferrales bacterium]